jgi:DNA-binding MarR family transcriptional regulator
MAKKLLEIIAVRHHNDQPMTVGDIMSLSALGSPATLHRKLDDLREAGLIDMVFEAGNRRTKYLVPTKEAYRYFDQMGKALATAVKAG